MDLTQAEIIIRGEMFAHGLTSNGWVFKWDRAKGRNGSAHSRTKTITLSSVLTPMRSEADVRMTILHEIAHALVGTHHQHNAIWRAKFVSMGGDGKRCSSDENGRKAAEAIAKYRVVCEKGTHLGYCNRKGKRLVRSLCKCHRAPLVFITQN